MLSTRSEIAAIALVLVVLVGVPAWVVVTESRSAAVRSDEALNLRLIRLTAVANGGTWTEEEMVGHSYWRRHPQTARLVVRVGETVVIRLKSADVSHSFSIPDLEVGPIPVEPGYVSEARFIPKEPGEYLFQCAIRCGACHEEMLGTIVVLGAEETLANYPDSDSILPQRTKCLHHIGGEK